MHLGRTLKVLNTLPAHITITLLAVCTSASAVSATTTGAVSVFNYPNGFANANGAVKPATEARLSGSAIDLTGLAEAHQAGGAWYTTQQNIQSFTTDFTFQLAVAGSIPSIQAIMFCVQNSNSTTNPAYFGDSAAG